jgi:hypothetical protein
LQPAHGQYKAEIALVHVLVLLASSGQAWQAHLADRPTAAAAVVLQGGIRECCRQTAGFEQRVRGKKKRVLDGRQRFSSWEEKLQVLYVQYWSTSS